MARVDITVRGGGIFGLSCAYACARRGAKVRLIEAVAIGAGASGGVVGALSPHAPENWNEMKEYQFQSLVMAEGWWQGVAGIGGRDPGYARSGRLQPVLDANGLALAHERSAAAATLWQGKAVWRLIPAGAGPWEPASPSGWLIHDTLSGRIAPRAALAALVAALQALGGEVVIGDAPDEGAVIHATGIAGLDALSAQFGRKLGSGVKGQAALLRHAAADLPQIFTDGLYIVPHVDGLTAIGSTSENDWQVPGTDRQVLDLVAQARVLLPVLAGAEPVETWAGIRPRAKSRAPVLGPWPGRPGHFIANGGFKTGFGMAPLVAEQLAELVLTGQDSIPARLRPEGLLAG